MNKQRPRLSQLVGMVLFALSCFCLLLFLWTSFGGPVPLRGQPYQVTTQFKQGAQLADYADVRVSGVTVGKVIGIEREGGAAEVTIKIDPEFAPLPADTRATLRTKTLLGETFVQLSFGNRRDASRGVPGSFIPDGEAIPGRQVAATAELDQILDAFDERTRRDLRRLITSLDRGLDERGQDFNAAIGDLGPTLESADGLLRILNRQSDMIKAGTRDLGTTFTAVGRRAGAVQELVRSGARIVEETSAVTGPLRETVRIFPTLLDETRSTLAVARAAAADARPALAALRPVTPLIRPALRDLAVVAPQLERTLVELGPIMRRADTGLPALRRILDATGPLMDSLAPVTQDLLPVAKYLEAYRREIGVVFANSAAAINASAPDMHGVQRTYLRFSAPLNGEAIMGYPQRVPSNRHNAYPAPGELSQYGPGGTPATFSCANAANPPAGLSIILDLQGNVPCRTQRPLTFEGTSSQFPRVPRAEAPTP
ncbi:MAG: MlaD family protein [Solirubrobacteraceae bacterium]|nr:MlaD family protein [Solirubrobacteraceae bacterium]